MTWAEGRPTRTAPNRFSLSQDGPEKAGAIGKGRRPEPLGDRLAQVRVRLPNPEIDAGPHALPRRQHRHVLARMIGRGRRRIVAMIGCHEQ